MPEKRKRIATSVRAFLEPAWAEWHRARDFRPEVISQYTCGRSSLFLQTVLREDFGLKAEWKSGTPRYDEGLPELGPFGFRTEHRWEAHAWVEVEGFIVDVTADQFGAAPIIVTPNPDPRYGEGEDTALPESRVRRIETINALWPVWLNSDLRASLKTKK